MAKKPKKLILFLVEGATEVLALDTVLASLLKKYAIRFNDEDGDILTRFLRTSSIKKSIGDSVRNYLEAYGFQKSSVYKVVHLIDTDGCYAPDLCIKQDDAYTQEKGCFYTSNEILTDRPDKKIERNRNKRASIEIMTTLAKPVVLGTIPYEMYYFSCNREHALQGEINIDECRKRQLAREFRKEFADNPEGFLGLLTSVSPDTNLGYKDSWAYLKQGFHSLERGSNFLLFFNDGNLVQDD